MDFVEGGIRKEETMQEFADRFYLEAQTLISLKAASFIDVKSALLNAVQPNKNLSIALKSGIYGAHNVSNLIHHLLTSWITLKYPFPLDQEHSKRIKTNHLSLASLKLVKALPLNKQLSRKLGHMSRECKQPAPKVHHVGAEDNQDEEKSLVAHVHVPPLSPPSPLPPEDPGAPGFVPPHETALTLEPADPKALTLASPSLGSTDPDASPLLFYPYSQEIEEDQLYRILAINALTRGRRIRKEPLITPEAQETVALPYAEQMTLPTTEVTLESDSAKKMAQILKSVNVSASLMP
ncbi:hypothetical protein DSO57_1010287 [Entomophthora muscae]|uniref:Uncharacterized protein n=1 Tax=Entomophthora muscae TaxID=34485 RepID=A0ACC2T6M5_9FUNG|nr:hypothetical protein DSO57_1010287 [Entomophthora muscae]